MQPQGDREALSHSADRDYWKKAHMICPKIYELAAVGGTESLGICRKHDMKQI